MTTKPDWRGVFPAATTQFNENQELDFDAQAHHLEALLEAGVQGVIMAGSLGENTALEDDEKRALLEFVIKAVNGRVPVLSGVSETSTRKACRYAADMEKLGADGIMLLPAMVYKADPRETMAHFREVAKASELPIICYNNPVAYGVDLTPEMFAEMADEERFVGIKESAADTRRYTELRNAVGDRYTIFTGVDDVALESIFLGAEGWIMGSGLAFPKENQAIWNLAQAGEWDKAREIYRWFLPLCRLDTHIKFVQYIKLAQQENGLGNEWVRMPRMPLVGEERERILKIIRDGIEARPDLS